MNPTPKYIEIETSRLCNRHCNWCPNGSFADRRKQELMDWNLFIKIIDDISTLNFCGWLAFHNYNEPLLNSRLEEEIATVSKAVPKCKPSIFTNGDILSGIRVLSLAHNGAQYLRVTLYPPTADTSATPEKAENELMAYISKKKLTAICDWRLESVRQGWAAKGMCGAMAIEIIYPDLKTYNWRGGTSPAFAGDVRTKPCAMTSSSASIDYRGQMKMCCNVFLEDLSHKKYRTGDLNFESFSEAWLSKQMSQYRELHGQADWSRSEICTHCSQSLPGI